MNFSSVSIIKPFWLVNTLWAELRARVCVCVCVIGRAMSFRLLFKKK